MASCPSTVIHLLYLTDEIAFELCSHEKREDNSDYSPFNGTGMCHCLYIMFTDTECVDQYLQRRRIDPLEAQQYVLDKLADLQDEDETYISTSTIGNYVFVCV